MKKIHLPADPVGPAVAMVRSHDTTAEVGSELVQQIHIALVLHDGEFRQDLIAALQVGVTIDPDVKAALTVHEACDPFGVEFHWQIPDVKSLRVPCACRAFPADCPHVRLIFTFLMNWMSTERLCEEFPAYGPVLLKL